MESRRGETPHTDANRTDHDNDDPGDFRKGHAPSYGLARLLHDLDIEEFDRQFAQHRQRRERGDRR